MPRRRRSDRFLLALGCLGLLSAITVGDALVRGGGEPGGSRQLAGRLGLSDLALATAARYTRHPSVADWHAAFQDHPAALDHFPAGAVIPPPPHLRGR